MKRLFILTALSLGSVRAAPQPVTLALDWVPNVNHVGVYVALAKGWYEQAGVNLRVLPYGSTSPDILVAAGRADVGVSSAEGVTSAAASGQPVVSIAAIYTTNTAAFAVLTKSGIRRPRDLDGKVYAAFGAPYETPIIKRLITADGGRGNFRSPVLNTFGLDALLAGKADFMWIFEGVEGVEARRKGLALRSFPLTKYGVPDSYTPVFTANRNRLGPDRVKLQGFLRATARGYEFARRHPAEAADLMLRAAPKNTFPDPGVLREGVRYFVDRGAYARPGHPWGEQTLKMWTDYPRFLVQSGAVRQPSGQPVRGLNYAALFTNTLLPR
ncbi:ABC transporter substrate-binding protein (plasmid) [Deinococcus metallilatus]|uniref:Thiamine pyrimidine synthase n=1 Tax=Deinococcus metallilatus TaxID=1211322 RepID=A0ABR6MVM0_9DEIO|nr:ABC transporter substrate-binding protein [Deinococcus metallilatus]MBB5295734.1 ABC-type nitrate/sulfonate/bicarbonate transport system substrate-binding protein [Deinococcus metallilatus]QBY06820.1 ABC transporter substrate-binding protein [Deinococcus metallilatus]GMA14264.1 nitrate ABC transporter substrate-binding protein [Deinococcus metallilatus]